MSSFDCAQEIDTTALRCFPADGVSDLPISVPLQKPKSRAERLHELLQTLAESESPPAEENSQRGLYEVNQRQYSRCRIYDHGTAATFSANGRDFDCEIVEMSIGGFGILVPRSTKLMPGTEGTLRAPTLNYIVGVTRLEIRPEGTFIGLKQIEEILDYQEHLAREHSRSIGYLIAGLAGALIVATSYHFMHG